MAGPIVGVVGASARAAVHSLARAGFATWAVDLFADRDLARVASCALCPMADYPGALPELAGRFPPGPIVYTGGLENHPAVVDRLATNREVWGNPPAVLEAVRDPHQLFPALAAAGLATPAIAPSGSPCPETGRWLRKPLRSSAGHGIRFATPGEPASASHFFQEFIDGQPVSGVFSNMTLIGVTEQLVGEAWLHAKPFAYCGSVGRAKIDSQVFGQSLHAGLVLASEFRLRGVWNADFMVKDGKPHAVEVNPRYSASVEVVEHATRQGVWSARSASGLEEPARRVNGPHIGKAIYFAPHAITFPDFGPWDVDIAEEFDPWWLPAFADIPESGSTVYAGQPVITVLVSGSSTRECRERLQSRAAELDHFFGEQSP
jgi:predicted ATP-grasp superfamily ATP-dependent carboligase